LQKQVATLLGLPPEKVEVNVTLIGGGFGRRLAVDYALEAAEISRAAKAPVQVLWSRPDDMKHGHFQAASAHFLSIGLDVQNKPVAWKHTKAGSFHNLSTIESEKLRDAAWYRGYSWAFTISPTWSGHRDWLCAGGFASLARALARGLRAVEHFRPRILHR